MIKVALFMTMNHDMTKYSGMMNLINRLNDNSDFEVHLLYKSNVPDSVMKFINNDTKFIHTKYSTSYTNGDNPYFDYIITTDPYYGPYCKGQGYNKWKDVKIIFCEYGITGLDDSVKYLFKSPIYNVADLVVTDTEMSRDEIVEVSGRTRDIIIGNPVFDHKNSKGNKIVWSPHCSVYNSRLSSKILGGKRYSTFMTYKDAFINDIPEYFSNHNFMYKLHPSLGLRIQNMNDETDTLFDLDEWIETAKEISNVEIIDRTRGYLEIFDESEMILNDSISFIAEYLVTGKPMIVLRDDGSSRFSDHAEKIIKNCYYSIDNLSDLKKTISLLLLTDPKKDTRIEFMKKYYKLGDSNCDQIIDYMRSNV